MYYHGSWILNVVICFRVDFVKYPSLKDVEYFNVTMEPGDCLFIPYKWWVSYCNIYSNKILDSDWSMMIACWCYQENYSNVANVWQKGQMYESETKKLKNLKNLIRLHPLFAANFCCKNCTQKVAWTVGAIHNTYKLIYGHKFMMFWKFWELSKHHLFP